MLGVASASDLKGLSLRHIVVKVRRLKLRFKRAPCDDACLEHLTRPPGPTVHGTEVGSGLVKGPVGDTAGLGSM